MAGGSLVNVSVSGLQPDGVPVCLFGPPDAPIEVGAPCDPLEFLARVVLLNVLLPTRSRCSRACAAHAYLEGIQLPHRCW